MGDSRGLTMYHLVVLNKEIGLKSITCTETKIIPTKHMETSSRNSCSTHQLTNSRACHTYTKPREASIDKGDDRFV